MERLPFELFAAVKAVFSEGATSALLVSPPSSESLLSLSELDEVVEWDETANSNRDTLDADLLLLFVASKLAALSFVADASLEADVLGLSVLSSDSWKSPLLAGVQLPRPDFSGRKRTHLTCSKI